MPFPKPPPQAHLVNPAYGSNNGLLPLLTPPSSPTPTTVSAVPLHPTLARNEALLNEARHAQATTPRLPPQPPTFLATLAFSVGFWLAILFLLLGAISTGASIGVLNAEEGYKPSIELWLVLSLVVLLFGVLVLVGVVGVIKDRVKEQRGGLGDEERGLELGTINLADSANLYERAQRGQRVRDVSANYSILQTQVSPENRGLYSPRSAAAIHAHPPHPRRRGESSPPPLTQQLGSPFEGFDFAFGPQVGETSDTPTPGQGNYATSVHPPSHGLGLRESQPYHPIPRSSSVSDLLNAPQVINPFRSPFDNDIESDDDYMNEGVNNDDDDDDMIDRAGEGSESRPWKGKGKGKERRHSRNRNKTLCTIASGKETEFESVGGSVGRDSVFREDFG